MRNINDVKAHERVYQFMQDGSTMFSFLYTFKDRKQTCTVIFSIDHIGNGKFVEHASFSILGKGDPMPTWEQKCEVKDVIRGEEEECYQIFPKASEYVHSYKGLSNVMHIRRDIPAKPEWGLKNNGE